jgi:hypothetical protein
MFKDDITHKPLVVSNKSTDVIVRSLVAAHRAGVINDEEYSMTYAEVCEIGFLPQAFGGKPVDEHDISRWKSLRSWE